MSSQNDEKTFGDRLENFLRARHPIKTADHVAALTGCSRAQVLKWLERSSRPNCDAFIALWKTYGPEFLAAVCDDAPDWLDEACRAEQLRQRAEELRLLRERQDKLREEWRALQAR